MNTPDQNVALKLVELIRSKHNILLTTHAKMDCDALSSTLALYLILRKMGKNVTAICQDPVPEAFKFLPDTSLMNTGFSANSDFIITLDISKTPLEELQWNVEGNKVNIILSPKEGGYFSEQELSFHGGRGKNFDLIIACDAADIQQLGGIYEQNAEMFHSTPLLVIDHHASNEGFGMVNYIVPTNASTTETLYDLIPVLTGKNYEFVDADIATLLLAGIITDTGSFQHPNTTPKSFEVAADLIDMGARQQEIIKNLFKTKKLTTLRLWGRVLSRIKYDPVHRFVWSTVTQEDFSDEHATAEETEGLIDELMSNAPGVEIILLLKERDDGIISGSLRTTTPLCDATKIAGMFGGGGHRQAAGFKIKDAALFEGAITDVVRKINAFQEERLGISPASQPTESKTPAVEKKSEQKPQGGSDKLLKKALLQMQEKSQALEKPSDFETKQDVPSLPEEKSRALENLTDFETKERVPNSLEKEPRTLEKITDFSDVKKSEGSTPKKVAAEAPPKAPEKLEEIPDWLYEKKALPPEPKEDLNGTIPAWLKEAGAEKQQKARVPESTIETPAANSLSPELRTQRQEKTPETKENSRPPEAAKNMTVGKNAPQNQKKKKPSDAPRAQTPVQKTSPEKTPAPVAQKASEGLTPEVVKNDMMPSAVPTSPQKTSPAPQLKQTSKPSAPVTPPAPVQKPAEVITPKPISPPDVQKNYSTPVTPPAVPQATAPETPVVAQPAPVPPVVAAQKFTAPGASAPLPEKKTPPKAPERSSSPLGNILDPNPPADLIPQMPKAPAPRPQQQFAPPPPPPYAPQGYGQSPMPQYPPQNFPPQPPQQPWGQQPQQNYGYAPNQQMNPPQPGFGGGWTPSPAQGQPQPGGWNPGMGGQPQGPQGWTPPAPAGYGMPPQLSGQPPQNMGGWAPPPPMPGMPPVQPWNQPPPPPMP